MARLTIYKIVDLWLKKKKKKYLKKPESIRENLFKKLYITYNS